MKNFTSKNTVQKIIIVLIMVVTFNFVAPKPVQADWGGTLLSPIFSLATALLDGVQHLLEMAMLGETTDFMRDMDDPEIKADGGVQMDVEQEIDGSFLGLDAVNIPIINYTPEEIFSNRVPALDINFINPSIKTGDSEVDEERNIAIQLRPIIGSWYVAIRMLSMIGLLSVLVYLGIRMLLTSIAADKAKYKKMIMDWVVAMCLLFVLHFIMSLALTITETITSMISTNGETILVNVTTDSSIPKFSTNLMGYVRFMIQSKDLNEKIAFFFLYLMLIIYSVRFTWVYLKRVVNMAFLTLIAPLVALTYPIDKVSDGKAQAFDLWLKEFTFNALIQPLHLLLYIVLLGSATELAVINPLYAVVALGFIIAAEKLLKQMFGFNKASGGTLGSLAGAAGVSALAGKALNTIGAGKGGSGKGKLRTNDKSIERSGKNKGANKPFDAFGADAGRGLVEKADIEAGNGVDTNEQPDGIREENNNAGGARENPPQGGLPSGAGANGTGVDTTGSPNPRMTEDALKGIGAEGPESWSSLRRKDKEAKKERWNDRVDNFDNKMSSMKQSIGTKEGRAELRRKAGVGAYKTIRGAKAAVGTAAYKGARGAIKTGGRLALGAALGATAGVIGATMGDGEKSMSMAAAGFGVGAATGGNLFESTAGKAMRDKSIGDSFGAAKHGNAIDARNERADKEFLKSEEFNDYYEKHFKGDMNKTEAKQIFKSYREAGITNNDEIRKSIKLEKQLAKDGYQGDARAAAQNIVSSRDLIDKKAFIDEKAKKVEINRISKLLDNVPEKDRNKVAQQIFKGYETFRDL